jgi:bifunctional non-homologous end joining protein LigD
MLELPIKPMLCQPSPAPVRTADGWQYSGPFAVPETGMFLFEPKWDGNRCIAVKDGSRCLLYSRSGRILNDEYPALVEQMKSWALREVVLDGEIVAYDKSGRHSFQALQRRRMQPTTLAYKPFDLLYLNGADLRRMMFHLRRDQLVESVPLLDLTPTPASFDGRAMWEVIAESGAEGIIIKPARSLYIAGSRGPWLKVKVTQRQQHVVVGYTEGDGRRAGLFGALVLAQNVNGRLVFAGKVGTGFTLADAKKVLDTLSVASDSPLPTHEAAKARRSTQRDITWVQPDRSATIEFSDTTEDGMPRFPSFKGLS